MTGASRRRSRLDSDHVRAGVARVQNKIYQHLLDARRLGHHRRQRPIEARLVAQHDAARLGADHQHRIFDRDVHVHRLARAGPLPRERQHVVRDAAGALDVLLQDQQVVARLHAKVLIGRKHQLDSRRHHGQRIVQFVRDSGRHRRQRIDGFVAPRFALHRTALGDVRDERDHQLAAMRMHDVETDLDRKFTAVFAASRDFHPAAHRARSRRREKRARDAPRGDSGTVAAPGFLSADPPAPFRGTRTSAARAD